MTEQPASIIIHQGKTILAQRAEIDRLRDEVTALRHELWFETRAANAAIAEMNDLRDHLEYHPATKGTLLATAAKWWSN